MLAEKFAEQVERTPQRLAVQMGAERLTYGELNLRANRAAHAVLSHLPQNGGAEVVALLFDHGIGMIVHILATLKAGKIYVPLSLDYPDGRLVYMLRHSGARLLLCSTAHEERARRLAAEAGCRVCAEEEIGAATPGSGENPCIPVPGDQTAYILYTSGSTGNPKGVPQIHANVMYYIRNWTERLGITADDRLTLFSSFCHDGSVQDMFGALCNGAALYPYHLRSREKTGELARFLGEERITIWHSVPSLYSYFLTTLADDHRAFPDLRYILLGGEPLREYDITMTRRHFPGVLLGNIYGQTESSVNTIWLIDPARPFDRILLGTPLDETEILLIGEDDEEVDLLGSGEIVVRSAYLSPGYWRDEETTAATFSRDEQLGRLYWTGDLGRSLPGGQVEFLGRRDFQVKIRGFRVEPGEVESQLLRHPDIREAVVMARGDRTGELYLCAYITVHRPLDAAAVRAFLATVVPDYMVPLHVVVLESFPLTGSNKIDRKALPEPQFSPAAPEAPQDEVQLALRGIWADILGLGEECIGIDGDFFALGGHSLRATILINRIHERLNVKVPLGEVFKSPTIRGLSEFIRHAGEDRFEVIEAVPPADSHPVSSAQRRIFVLDRMDEHHVGYHITSAVELTGRVDFPRLQRAFRLLIDRHEPFRTGFVMSGDGIVCTIREQVEFAVTRRRLDSSAPAAISEALGEFVRPFDLAQPPLLRATLLELAADRSVLLVDLHHIIADGTSVGILMREFAALYGGADLPSLRIHYKDFAAWQNRLFATAEIRRQEEYWLGQFADGGPLLDLPGDRPRPALRSFAGGSLSFALDTEETKALTRLGLAEDATVFMVLLSVFSVFLGRICRQEDVVVGTPVAGRRHANLSSMIGMFVNTLALRVFPQPTMTWREFLGEVRRCAISAFENQDYPFEELVEKLPLQKDLARNPLFDAMLIYQNMDVEAADIPEADVADLHQRPLVFEKTSAKFDLTLTALNRGERLVFSLEYSAALFSRETAERFAACLETLMREIIAAPDTMLGMLEIVPAAEKARMVGEWNATETACPAVGSVVELIRGQALRRPEAPAVQCGDAILDYRELLDRSERLAAHLRRLGLQPGEIAAVYAPRSPALIPALLAVLMAGGAYLPVDPKTPLERLDFLLRDSGARFLLTRPEWVAPMVWTGRVVDVEPPAAVPALPAVSVSPDDKAYVIYTSGSTGRPKGVVIRHGGLLNFAVGMGRLIDFHPERRMLALTTVSFDIFVLEYLLPLMNGMTVVLADDEQQADPRRLDGLLSAGRVTMMQVTPARLQGMLEFSGASAWWDSLETVLVGGEAFPPALLHRLQERFRGRIFNMYGPTETTVWSTVRELTGEREVTIGRPIANTRLYIVGAQGRLQPVGVPGELWIGGDGVALGYLNRPELTTERFLPDPFAAGRVYRTGDLARYRPDGQVECLGRLDFQLKIRGFRIEPGEIEDRLCRFPGVREAVVTTAPGSSLCAYLTTSTAIDPTAVREFLAAALPDYMIPAHFVEMAEFPLTTSGKIDRRSLPPPTGAAAVNAGSVPPAGPTETRLAVVWSEVLGLSAAAIGADSGFFQLGGNSLQAVLLLARLRQEFGVEVPLKELFTARDLRALAAFLDGAEKTAADDLAVVAPAPYHPASAAQERIYTLHGMDPDGVGTNIHQFVPLAGEVDVQRIAAVFTALVERHESLRTSFSIRQGRPVQVVQPPAPVEVERFRLESEAEFPAAIRRFVRPFALDRAPLVRVGVAEAGDSRLLMVDIHHIVADGFSLNILLREFTALYEGRALPALTHQYKDYAVWQQGESYRRLVQSAEKYWLSRFSGGLPVLQLPLDARRPDVWDGSGACRDFALDEETSRALRRMAVEQGVTLQILLLAVFYVLLSRLSGQEDIVVGTVTAGRRHPALETMVGVFVNTLALRNFPRHDMRFSDFLAEVRRTSLEAYEHQDFAFDELVRRLHQGRDTARHPFFDVMFEVRHMAWNQAAPAAAVRFQRPEVTRTIIDLDWMCWDAGGRLFFSVKYCTALFQPETIDFLCDSYRSLVEAVRRDGDGRLGDLPWCRPQVGATVDAVEDFEFSL